MGTCYVYIADVAILNYYESFQKYYNMVPKYRQQKIDAYKRKDPRILSLGAGTLLHMALAERGIDDTNLVPEEGDKGKPFYKGIDFQYNLSHSGTKVMCAVCDVNVGCDVEQVKQEGEDIDTRIKVAKRFFAPSEYEQLQTLFQERKTASGFTIHVLNEKLADMFYRYWTLKESVIKATGMGIFMDLSSFVVKANLDGTLGWGEPVESRVKNNLTDNLRTYEIEGPDGYRYSLCIDSKEEYDIQVKSIFLEGGETWIQD